MLQPGTTLNQRYTILSLVGRGGMGSVYSARDERLGREVAIKLLRPDLAADQHARERFLREGQIAAQIVHPNVVRTYDAGDDAAGTYLVQEFLTGRTLDQAAPLSPARAAEVMRGIAAALGHIHGRGYIHCDIKPQNILLKENGIPVLLDFGIARAEGADTTTLIATPHYLAPERAQGGPPTPASDLYALGIVLYQAATGHPPFAAPDLHAVIQQHIETPVPSIEGTDPVRGVLDRIIGQLTAKRPEDRYASAQAVEADLAAVGASAVHAQPTVAMAPVAPSAPASNPNTNNVVGAPVARVRAMPAVAARELQSLRTAWGSSPAWRRRRWLAAVLIPLLLLLLGISIARARRETADPAAMPSVPEVAVTAAPASDAPAAVSDQPIPVPDVIGLQFDAARQVLESKGLVGQQGEARPDQQAPGIVVQSDPPAATSLPPNSPVTLHVSAGLPQPPPEPVQESNPEPVPAPNDDDDDDDDDEANDGNKGKGKGKGKKDD